ncbi:hypothetical protein [Paenibacillus sp.]|uniref:hypothetical protein n=1 Tax=Paenibacillus sp. TaxID=58172 RepID=UPI002D6E6DE8|nr:hypothetical protein [Paenibacillus sp.]HZG58713.1 hypothetical protein [Paenibacillus sp.]
MNKRTWLRLAALAAIAGGAIWAWTGAHISLMPPGDPGAGVYRDTHSFMTRLGLGMALVTVGMTGVYASLRAPGRWTTGAYVAAAAGSLLYGVGTLVRSDMDMSVQFDPLQPLGFVLAMIGSLGFAARLTRSRDVPAWVKALLWVGAVSMVLFNDQFVTSWAAVPFGLSWVAIGGYLALQTGKKGE